jgi:hypothetical protein
MYILQEDNMGAILSILLTKKSEFSDTYGKKTGIL